MLLVVDLSRLLCSIQTHLHSDLLHYERSRRHGEVLALLNVASKHLVFNEAHISVLAIGQVEVLHG